MPKFFFHVRQGNKLFVDPYGSEWRNFDEALRAALDDARELVAHSVLDGPIEDQMMEVANEEGYVF